MRFFGFSVVVILKIVRVKNKMEIKHEKENIIEAILKLKYEKINFKLNETTNLVSRRAVEASLFTSKNQIPLNLFRMNKTAYCYNLYAYTRGVFRTQSNI